MEQHLSDANPASKGVNEQPTSTAVERLGLNASINLSDGHARVHDDEAIVAAFKGSYDIFLTASTRLQSELEDDFSLALSAAHNFYFPRQPILSYSASCLAAVVGLFLGNTSRILWSIPSFDNMRDVVRHGGPSIDLVPEDEFSRILADPPHRPWFDALWVTSPNNPTGLVVNEDEYVILADYAAKANVILIFDHCFRGYSPSMATFDQYRVLEDSGCRYILLEDTGKVVSSLDLKIGTATASQDIQPALQAINEDILLNVSPYTLQLMIVLWNAWRKHRRLAGLQSLMAENRRQIRAAYRGFGVQSSMLSEEVPFEWLDLGSPEHAAELLTQCTAQGLQLLPGASFFGVPNYVGSRYIRIALTRDESVIRAGASVLRRSLTACNWR